MFFFTRPKRTVLCTTPTKAPSPTAKRSMSLSPLSLSFASDETESPPSKSHPILHFYFGILIWFMLTALLLWHMILPKATQWWIEFEEIVPKHQGVVIDTAAELRLPGGYTSLEEMNNRSLRFPGVSQRVRIYMSDWYNADCEGMDHTSSSIKYTYVQDHLNDLPPLLLIQEKPTMMLSGSMNQSLEEPPYAAARTFVLDSAIVDKGARIFYLLADEIRRCDDPSCKDAVQFIFPSLHTIDMASPPTQGYFGNALDPLDGNRNGVVPIIFQFGDMEVSRAFVPRAHRNETYPVVPIFKKFRKSMSLDDIETAAACPDSNGSNDDDEPPMNPIIAKLTYKRHYGMLDEVQAADLAWTEKLDMAVFRGALTGMKRNGFRVVQNLATHTKKNMCQEIQRCRLVYLHRNSKLVNASLVDVMSEHPNNLISDPVVPAGLFAPRLSYTELLKYKAVIMLEGNDVSTGLKWALYSNSVVLMPHVTYTSWAMEELLEPWVHYIPISNSLTDVEEKVQWIIDNSDKAQAIAHAGKLWISDLVYHPHAADDDNAIMRETFVRYKQHFSLESDLALLGNLAYHQP